MILFSPAKINIGLQILRQRTDGYHELSTLMYILPFSDILEILPGEKGSGLVFTESGLSIDGKPEDNLCYRAWKLFSEYSAPTDVRIHLHKQIPAGAGLGGGSSNAAMVLIGLNNLSGTFTTDQLSGMAAEIGSDCPVFISGTHSLAGGRGEILRPSKINLKNYFLVLVKPGFNISTAEAYGNCIKNDRRPPLEELLNQPVKKWKDTIENDFEQSVVPVFPEIGRIKNSLYNQGAIYASLSGSGSAVYGIFREPVDPAPEIKKYIIWSGWL